MRARLRAEWTVCVRAQSQPLRMRQTVVVSARLVRMCMTEKRRKTRHYSGVGAIQYQLADARIAFAAEALRT